MANQETKQGEGIRIDGIVLKESSFVREPFVPEDTRLKLAFAIQNSLNNDGKSMITEMTCTVTGGRSVKMKATFVGVFSLHGKAPLSLEQYARINAPATLIPYLREEIHNRLQKANLAHLGILPPVNVAAMANDSIATQKKQTARPKRSNGRAKRAKAR